MCDNVKPCSVLKKKKIIKNNYKKNNLSAARQSNVDITVSLHKTLK